MTLNDYRIYFESLADADEKIAVPDKKAFVGAAIERGLVEFWGSHHWGFKMRSATVTVSSTAAVALPDDMESVRSVRETDSHNGGKLTPYSLDEFRRLWPDVSAVAAGTPRAFTVYENDGVKYIEVAPGPSSSMVLSVDYWTSDASIDMVPTFAQNALGACIAKHVYPYNHPARQVVVVEAQMAIQQAILNDRLVRAKVTKLPEMGEQVVQSGYTYLGPWVD